MGKFSSEAGSAPLFLLGYVAHAVESKSTLSDLEYLS